MDIFRSMMGAAGNAAASAASSGEHHASSAETIERLVERLAHSSLLDDRRDACRAIRAMSRKFRVEVGVQSLDPMTAVLANDAGGDEEIIGYALETLCNVCSPEEFEEEVGADNARDNAAPGGGGVGEQFTEIFLKNPDAVQLVIDVLEEFDFKVRRPAVKLLTHLLLNKPRELQDRILAAHMGVSRLMDILVDSREVLRNDALLLLIQLTKGNANLQKIVAFENCFDKLVDIVQVEGYSDGGIVVEDCLRLMLNLLRNNASNQTFFREGSYIQRVTPFFELSLDEDEIEVGWSAQKVSNMLYALQVIRTLVSPSNPTNVTGSCQATVLSCSLLEKLCSILMAAGIPADVLTETINTISECVRGNEASQEFFQRVNAPSEPPKPALILLLMSMVNEKQPFALRCAVLYCFQCYMHKNPRGQMEIMKTLLPGSNAQPDSAKEVTAGQLLCGGLFSSDKLSNWFSSVALAHGLCDQDGIKQELLRVQLATPASGNEPVSFLLQCCNVVQQTPSIQSRIGFLMMISTWVNNCPAAVSQMLTVGSFVPFLTGQIGSNEHDELERLGQGLCAFLLGLSIVNNDNSVAGSTQEDLYQLIEKRIGYEVYMDKLGEVSKHEAYNRAHKHPQLKCTEAKDLVFDHKFCAQFKHLEHVVMKHLTKKKENSAPDDTDPAVVAQYKELIRDQDTRITDLTNANLYLQRSLSAAQQQIEELSGTVQTLKDQNSLLRASKPLSNGPSTAAAAAAAASATAATTQPAIPNGGDELHKLEEEKLRLEREVRIRDDIIHELEMQLAGSPVKETPNDATAPAPHESAAAAKIELEMLQSQMEALHLALAKKDADLEDVQKLRSEQEDLLVLLADQDAQIQDYRGRLAALGQLKEGDGAAALQ